MDKAFLVDPAELALAFVQSPGERRLAFATHEGTAKAWRDACREKLRTLLGLANSAKPMPGIVTIVREARFGEVVVQALVMDVAVGLSIPAYLLMPAEPSKGTVMAIHGHGEVGPCLGLGKDYHHAFALRLAEAGYTVLCPELRGFGALRDLAMGEDNARLDYWNWGGHMAYSLVTDWFLYGRSLIGETVADLVCWEAWLAEAHDVTMLDVAGISYGGDLALIYPVFSGRVNRIFASGTLGSFSVVFRRCYNAPAHCIPGILQWMDRADIAGLNAPRPLALHYGELDTLGPDNHSASYNETVPDSIAELRAIYHAFNAGNNVQFIVSTGRKHEMDIPVLLSFLETLSPRPIPTLPLATSD
jgi:dienelactone hydrolase